MKVQQKTVPQHKAYDYGNDAVSNAEERSGSHAVYTLDTAGFNEMLAHADSLVKLKDNLYLVYKTPELQFVSSYLLEDAHTKEKILSSFEIYNRSLRNPPVTIEGTAIAKEWYEVQKKYLRLKKPYYTEYEEVIQPGEGSYSIIRKKHHVSKINRSIWNIVNKKYNFKRDLGIIERWFYYATLGITLLIFVFRHTTVRTFFLSLLSGVLLTIFTAIVMSFLKFDSVTFTGWMICYALLFFVGSIFTFSSAKRSVLNGILINLFVFIVPVFPLLVFALFYAWKEKQYYEAYHMYEVSLLEQYLPYTEIGGSVLFLVLLATYINKLYRRWYSLPEN